MTNDHLMEGVTVPEGPGTYAHRIVLRDLGDQSVDRFVVHEQVFPSERGRVPFYVSGDYFTELQNAVTRFQERNGVNERRVAAARVS
jgi:hypothetical protein